MTVPLSTPKGYKGYNESQIFELIWSHNFLTRYAPDKEAKLWSITGFNMKIMLCYCDDFLKEKLEE